MNLHNFKAINGADNGGHDFPWPIRGLLPLDMTKNYYKNLYPPPNPPCCNIVFSFTNWPSHLRVLYKSGLHSRNLLYKDVILFLMSFYHHDTVYISWPGHDLIMS